MGAHVDIRPQDWKNFKGTLEIVIEVKTQKDANDFFSKLCNDIINNKKIVYSVKHSNTEEC